MGYDIKFFKDNPETTVDSNLNITSNFRPVFNWAYGKVYWVDHLQNLSAERALDETLGAIIKMTLFKKEGVLLEMNKSEEEYDYSLEFLIKLSKACLANLEYYIQINF